MYLQFMTSNTANKRDKFVNLAEKRVNNAIKAIKIVGNLSNRSSYEYSDRDVQKIVSALRQEIQVLQQRFAAGGSKPSNGFKL